MLERGVKVDHSTVQRWAQRYSDGLEQAFRNHHKKTTGYISWRMDETHIKVKGKWCYLYRAVDKYGDTLEFMLSEKRDEDSAFKFLLKAIGSHAIPEKITIDKSSANEAALIILNCMAILGWPMPQHWVEDRQIKYLNNMVEQDHRNIKRPTDPMLGFKSMVSAKSTISGYELISMLRKKTIC